MKKFETLEWKNNELILIDQRLLPTVEKYVVCRTVDEVSDAIKNMVVRGAPAIGCAAAFGFTIAVIEALEESKISDNLLVNKQKNFDELLQLVKTSKNTLANTRPTAVNLFWALERVQKVFDSNVQLKASDLIFSVCSEAKKILTEDIESNKKIGINGAVLLEDKVSIMTHCNAGALATAGHGTALGIIRSDAFN